jgi:hypothetical protein
MSRGIRVLVVVAMAGALGMGLILVGCGDDDDDDGGGGTQPDPITIADFEGAWNATQYMLTDNTNPTTSIDIIAMGGAFDFDVAGDGTFSGTGEVPPAMGGGTISYQGVFGLVSQDSVSATFNPEQPPLLTNFNAAFELQGDNLELENNDTTFDFGAGEVSAAFEGSFVRQ